MAILYTDRSTEDLAGVAANTWSRSPGIKVTGDITYKEAIYTLTAGTDEAAADIIRICKLPANAVLLPHLCKIIAEDPGTAFNISKIGDLSVDGITTPDDDDRYSGGVDISAGGAFDFLYAARPAGLAGYTTTKEMWLIATLGTITAPTAGAKVRFVIAYSVQS
jgi:hypothetical protein